MVTRKLYVGNSPRIETGPIRVILASCTFLDMMIQAQLSSKDSIKQANTHNLSLLETLQHLLHG